MTASKSSWTSSVMVKTMTDLTVLVAAVIFVEWYFWFTHEYKMKL